MNTETDFEVTIEDATYNYLGLGRDDAQRSADAIIQAYQASDVVTPGLLAWGIKVTLEAVQQQFEDVDDSDERRMPGFWKKLVKAINAALPEMPALPQEPANLDQAEALNNVLCGVPS